MTMAGMTTTTTTTTTTATTAMTATTATTTGDAAKRHLESLHAFSTAMWPMAIQCFLQDNPIFIKYGIPEVPSGPKYKCPLKLFCYLITFQALHHKVCEAIWAKLVNLMNKRMFDNGLFNIDYWNPEIVYSFTHEELYGRNGVGLSKRKIEAIRNIALYLQEHPLIFDPNMDSLVIIKDISKSVKGIGPFVVQHFLKEQGRLDIITHNDLVFRRGLQKVLQLEKVLTVAQSKRLTKKAWPRFQTIGTMYCFHIAHL